VLTNSGMAERTNILTLNDLSICIRPSGGGGQKSHGDM
jgi:hypothetical protein